MAGKDFLRIVATPKRQTLGLSYICTYLIFISMDNLTCNHSTLLNLSHSCLIQPNNSQCFPSEFDNWIEAEIIFALINSLSGFAGNLLTLLAIPYAAKRNQ